jgi:hypothetical protein
MLFQTNFSGRAEIGLTGDDDFHFKVSPDGSNWLDAIAVDKATGKLALGQGFSDPDGTRGQLQAAPFDALAFSGMQVNGGIDVSQELGTAGATLASGVAKYTADMWEAQYVHGAGSAVVTSAQLAAAAFPAALPGFPFAHQIKATTAISSIANGDYAKHIHKIEGHRVARLAWGAAGAQPIALAFWYYATAPGTAFIRLSNAAANRFYHREIAVAAGWNFVAETIPGDTAGTWEKTTSAGLIVEIFSAGKAASPATPDAWGATGSTQTVNSTNLLGADNNLTLVTGFVVLPGVELPPSARLPFIMRPFGEELGRCQRYWAKSYDYGTAPGTSATNGLVSAFALNTTTILGAPIVFSPRMRASPTITLYSQTGTPGKWSNTAGVDTAAATAAFISESRVGFISSSSLTAAAGYWGHFVANARL